MVAKWLALPTPVGAVRDLFPGEEFTNLLISCLNDSNEGILGGEAETRGFMVKCEERPLEGEVCEIPVRAPMNMVLWKPWNAYG